MKRLIVAASIILALSGCAGDWQDATGNGRGAPELQMDSANCQLYAQANTQDDTSQCQQGDAAGQTGCLLGAVIADGLVQGLAFNNCMTSLGWKWEKNQATEAPINNETESESPDDIESAYKLGKSAYKDYAVIAGIDRSSSYLKKDTVDCRQESKDAAEKNNFDSRDEAKVFNICMNAHGWQLAKSAHDENDTDADDSTDDDLDADEALARGDAAYEDNDYAGAMEWYRVAAEQGEGRTRSKARKYIGIMYENGSGVPKDHAEAMKWHHQSGRQRVAEKSVRLAEIPHRNRASSPKVASKPKPCKSSGCK